MNIYLRLLSGEILTFSIFEGYKFSNLRSDFYKLRGDIPDLECIVIFDNNNKVNLKDEVIEENTYNVIVNQLVVRIIFDDTFNRLNFEHDYQQFPYDTIIHVTKSVQNNYDKSYTYMYNKLSDDYEEYPFSLFSFREYINNKYKIKDKDDNLEELILEFIERFISKNVKVKEFIY